MNLANHLTPLVWAAVGFAGIYLFWFCYRGVSWIKTVIKTASILLLAVAAWQISAPNWLIAALTFCAIGDLLLSREDDRSFLAGVAAFALGHVAYISLIVSDVEMDFGLLVTSPRVFLVIGLVVLAIAMAVILLPRAGELRIAVLAYIPIIVGLGLAASGLPKIAVLPGALLFVLSDFVLALEMFVLKERSPLRRLTPFVVWVTYWSAQFILFVALS